MKKIFLIVFIFCFTFAASNRSSIISIDSAEDVIMLTAKKTHFELKNRTGFSNKNINEKALEKRRHKRRRKVRPPKHGK